MNCRLGIPLSCPAPFFVCVPLILSLFQISEEPKDPLHCTLSPMPEDGKNMKPSEIILLQQLNNHRML